MNITALYSARFFSALLTKKRALFVCALSRGHNWAGGRWARARRSASALDKSSSVLAIACLFVCTFQGGFFF